MLLDNNIIKIIRLINWNYHSIVIYLQFVYFCFFIISYLKRMVEIIHRFSGGYPFGLQMQTGLTYVDLFKENLSEQQVSDYRLKYKIMKEMNCPNIVKLIKILKDDHNMHLIYEYCPLSIHKYIQTVSSRHESQKQITIRQQFVEKFVSSINAVVDSLVHYQIKGDLLISNIAIQQQRDNGYVVKIFIDPDADCMGLHLPISTEQRHSLKQKIQQNRVYLREHYEIEKKRLIFGLDELLQGKLALSSSKVGTNAGNFTISGTKLVFSNNGANKQQKEEKDTYIQSGKSHIFVKQAFFDQAKIEKAADAKRQLRAKNSRKIEEIKKNLAQLEMKKQIAVEEAEEAQEGEQTEQVQQNKFTVNQNRLSFNTDIVFKYDQVAKQRRTATEEEQCLLSSNIEAQSKQQKGSLRSKVMKQKKSDSPIDNNQLIQRNETKQHLIPIQSQQLTMRQDKSIKHKGQESPIEYSSINLHQNRRVKPTVKQLQIIQEFKDNTIIEADLQKQQNPSKPFKVNDQTENKKKISDIIDRLNLKSNMNLGQISSDKNGPTNAAKLQSIKIMRPSLNESQENQAQNFKHKIQAAKDKVEQVIKDYKRSRKE